MSKEIIRQSADGVISANNRILTTPKQVLDVLVPHIADLEQQLADKTAEAEKYLTAWERLDAQQPPAQGELTAERETVLVGLLRHWLHGESDGYIDIEVAEEWELELWKNRAAIQPTTGDTE